MSYVEVKTSTKTCVKVAVTMAVLKTKIMADAGLEARKKITIGWALGTVCRAFDHTLDSMPADPGYIGQQLKGFAPAQAGLAKGTWQNAIVLTRFAMRRAGIIKTPPRRIERFSSAWTEVMKLPRQKTELIGLSRLARYCTDHSIAPEDVNDSVFDDFLVDLTTNAIIKQPKKAHRLAAVIWNKLTSTTRGWPNQTVKVPNYSRAYFVGWDTFPATLVADIESHLHRMSGGDILDGPAKPLKPASIKTRRHQLGAYLSALVLSGEDPDNLKTLADAVEVARVRKGIRFFLSRSENRLTSQTHDIVRMLVSVARHEVQVSGGHLEALQTLRKKVDDGSPGMSEKNKTRLRQFDDEGNVDDLLHLPSELAAKAKREVAKNHGVVTQAAALRYQSALAIDLLLMVPMRRENLTRLNVDQHIDRRRNGKVYIFIRGDQVKNGLDIEAELPPQTIKMLGEYMKTYHPVLTEHGSPWMFPGLPGRPKSRERMSMQVSDTIKQEIGLDVHMHLFRHIAAKLYLDRHPGAYGVVQKINGHKHIQTTINSYCGMEAKSAIKHYDQHILGLRDKSPRSPKKRAA